MEEYVGQGIIDSHKPTSPLNRIYI